MTFAKESVTWTEFLYTMYVTGDNSKSSSGRVRIRADDEAVRPQAKDPLREAGISRRMGEYRDR